ncbi:hypothetical protein BHE74_00006106 [Ensete ventricosum]|nr:hypothetical protein BHE74_00006106 [Ensete ventricosum]
MRTGRYQMVPLKSAVDGRLKKSIRRKKKYLAAVLACTLPARPHRPRVDREPSPARPLSLFPPSPLPLHMCCHSLLSQLILRNILGIRNCHWGLSSFLLVHASI